VSEHRDPAGARGPTGTARQHDRAPLCPSENDLLELLAGAGAESEAEHVRRHLDACEECRAAIAALLRGGATPQVVRRPGDRVGRYRILRRLGAGAMGVVHAALDPDLDRDVALKLLRPAGDAEQVRARLRREAKALARVSHPNVTAIYDVGIDHDPSASAPVVYVAMELVDGVTLRRWLADGARSWRDVVDMLGQAARGLQAAHEAGVVHRDVKPENILVGRDGRVRVTDFGLAQLGAGDAEPRRPTGPAITTSIDDDLTATGTLVGTPAYMAPEQFEGLRADARSDQFALCVVLYEALFGRRPFAGLDLQSLGRAVLDGRLERPPTEVRVPAWLRALVMRGLARRPADRFPSLAPIADALTDPPRPWFRSAPALVLGTTCLLGLAAWPYDDSRGGRSCSETGAQLFPAWGDERRTAVRESIRATATPFADDVATRVDDGIQRWSDAWVREREALCEAMSEHGPGSDALLDLRLACLDRGRRELSALTDALARADWSLVEEAVQLVDRLPAIESCREPHPGSRGLSPPRPAIAERVGELRSELADADVRIAADQLRLAETLASDVLAEATRLDDAPLHAEALLAVARSIDARVRPDEAEHALFEAGYAAEAAGHDEVAARAWIDLVYVTGYLRLDFARGRELSRQADAALKRLGSDVRLELELVDRLGLVEGEAGEEARAIESLEHGVARAEVELGRDSLELAQLLETLAVVQRNRGELGAAVSSGLRSLEIREARLGPLHPGLVPTMSTLAGVLTLRDDTPRAMALLHRALAIQISTSGREHPDTATLLSLMAFAYESMPAPVQAVALLDEAVAISERTAGPDDANLARMVGNRGRLYGALGRWDEAEVDAQRFVDIVARTRGEEHTEYAAALYFLGDTVRMRGEPERALAPLETARAIYARTTPAQHPDAVQLMATLGGALSDLQRWDESATIFAAAFASLGPATDAVGPDRRREILANYGEALWESGRDRVRARELVQAAATAYRSSDPAVADDLDRWLASHP
jgi:serine/threonine protein kinase/tetratricopeptide (TPR) repeat protein